MEKIVIFRGSNEAFSEQLPTDYRSLTDIVTELDDNRNHMTLEVTGLPNQDRDEKERYDHNKKIQVENFVIYSNEYSSVQEHVIINFANYIAQLDIKNMFIQNPPLRLIEQLHRIYEKNNIIIELQQPYNRVTTDVIKEFYSGYEKRIIGQNIVKTKLLQALYPLVNDIQKKPVVILFYGNTGIGKTETACYLSELLKGRLMRKQFSMFQSNDFATYLFGGKNNESSFAKDLLERDSNVILLDEFDKANPVFHSAFYQLFDEGIYEDKNYKVNLNYAVVICTSNYKTEKEIKEHLGEPIFNRFDAVIHFSDLSVEAKEKIAKNIIEEISYQYNKDCIGIDDAILERLIKTALYCDNVREIKRIVKDTFSLYAVRKLCDFN